MIVFEQPGIWKPDRLCLTHNINTALCILYVDKEKGINEIIRIVLHLESKKILKNHTAFRNRYIFEDLLCFT